MRHGRCLSFFAFLLFRYSEAFQFVRNETSQFPCSFELEEYQPYDKILEFCGCLASSFSDYVKLESIGTTHEQRPILLLKISANLTEDKPIIWADGGLHSREWASQHAVAVIAYQLAEAVASGGDEVVARFHWFLVPVANPDGYLMTWNTSTDPWNRMWRKNKSPARCSVLGGELACCQGVDLNRNFGYHWAERGLGGRIPCIPNYAGPRAFSEPETRAIRDVITRHLPAVLAFVSLHTYGQLWLYPYSYKAGIYPKDIDDLIELAEKGTKSMEALYGHGYIHGTTPSVNGYAATGTAQDWAKSVGVRFPLVLEMRPSRWGPGKAEGFNGFLLPANQLLPAAEEVWTALKVIAHNLDMNYTQLIEWRLDK